ncbi:MAG TPA: hypothetical protein VHE33_04440, partial [Acidobacteriaceae bacterium]|nr:hypothetical protein [Acidobacteriaceae bacterium]
TAGQVSATLASGTAEAHHAIAAQLPAVREFLAGEHVRIDALSSERFSSSTGGQGRSSGDPAGNDGRTPVRSPQQERPAQPSPVEMDREGMSYISVRV